jgi:type VI secretion system secreted protein Hcp
MAAYMKFGGIKGDATQDVGSRIMIKDEKGKVLIKDPAFLKEHGWINISDFSWSITRSLTHRSGSQGNLRDPLQPSVDEITVKKDPDHATSRLLRAICYAGNNNAETCTIIFVRTGNPGEVYMHYKLANVFITDIHIKLEDERPVETLKINFTKVEMAHLSSDVTNVLSTSGPDRFEFDKQTAPAGSAQAKSA